MRSCYRSLSTYEVSSSGMLLQSKVTYLWIFHNFCFTTASPSFGLDFLLLICWNQLKLGEEGEVRPNLPTQRGPQEVSFSCDLLKPHQRERQIDEAETWGWEEDLCLFLALPSWPDHLGLTSASPFCLSLIVLETRWRGLEARSKSSSPLLSKSKISQMCHKSWTSC